MTRLAYLGTPEAAVAPLRALVAAGHDVAVVVSRPDRRRGRGSATSPSPVKQAASELGLDVTDDLAAVSAAGVTLGVVVAFGRIIPADLLAVVPMVNIHFSLLPRWRGAAPVERAILAGDPVTGVSLMALEAELDTGPVYVSEEVVVGDAETAAALRERLVEVGSALVVDLLSAPLPEPHPQVGEVTYAEKLTPADLELHWDQSADELVRLVRVGRAWTTFRGRRLGVLAAEAAEAPSGLEAGTLVGDSVVASSGALRLLRVQPEGSRPMDTADWRRGAWATDGERL